MAEVKIDPASPGFRAAVALVVTGVGALAAVILFPDEAYLWVKALHVIAVISWMAGMLYLPRLFIYHCAAPAGSEQSETFKVMERRLLRIIVNPAMVVAWVSGVWLAWKTGVWAFPWFWVKFAAVFALSGVHGHFSTAVRRFGRDENAKSEGYWRVVNEVPTILMIVIVIMVIVRPI